MRIVTLVLVLCAALTGGPTRAEQRPNIVIIYTDDLGYGDLSSDGATALETPNIDGLASRGLRFTDAHAAAATCTGNDPAPHLYDLATDPGERTNVAAKFPDRLKEMQRLLEEIRKAGRSRP